MSPYEARILKTPPAEKVQGKRLMHFWAFFDRTARENDYLWGRLDGAAHLIGILLGKQHPQYRHWCLRAFAAILEEDEDALTHVRRHGAHAAKRSRSRLSVLTPARGRCRFEASNRRERCAVVRSNALLRRLLSASRGGRALGRRPEPRQAT